MVINENVGMIFCAFLREKGLVRDDVGVFLVVGVVWGLPKFCDGIDMTF